MAFFAGEGSSYAAAQMSRHGEVCKVDMAACGVCGGVGGGERGEGRGSEGAKVRAVRRKGVGRWKGNEADMAIGCAAA